MQAKLSTTTVKSFSPSEKPYEIMDVQIKGFLLRVQPTGRKTFYFSYRNQARKRQRIKIGVFEQDKTVAQARDDAKDFAAQVSKGIDVHKEKSQHTQSAIKASKNTLGAFIEDHYKSWAQEHLKSADSSLDKIAYSFADYMHLPLHEIDVPLIEKWRTDKQKAGLKPSTINRAAASLRAVLSKAVMWNLIEQHPLQKLKALKVDKSPKVRFLSEAESVRLYQVLAERDEDLKLARERGNHHRSIRGYELLPDLSACTYADRMTPLITLALKTGMRKGELFDLLWANVDLDNQFITVTGDTAKSHSTRHIALSPMACDALDSWKKQAPQPEGRVFPNDDGGRLDNVRKSWASILKTAEIESFRWHDMRHDFASQLVMKGVDLNTVRELCGHADYSTTLRYAHLAPEHKADAVALIG